MKPDDGRSEKPQPSKCVLYSDQHGAHDSAREARESTASGITSRQLT